MESGVDKLTDDQLRAARDFGSIEYQRLCEHLGFDHRPKFVEVTPRLSIGYTIGHPDEIDALYMAIGVAGYRRARVNWNTHR